MARRSRRLEGRDPEVDSSDFRCLYCLDDESDWFDVLRGVVRMPCCGKFAHRSCQERWEDETIYCAHCRKELLENGVQHVIEDPVRRGAVHALQGRLEDPAVMPMFQVSVTYKNFNLENEVMVNFKPGD